MDLSLYLSSQALFEAGEMLYSRSHWARLLQAGLHNAEDWNWQILLRTMGQRFLLQTISLSCSLYSSYSFFPTPPQLVHNSWSIYKNQYNGLILKFKVCKGLDKFA